MYRCWPWLLNMVVRARVMTAYTTTAASGSNNSPKECPGVFQ